MNLSVLGPNGNSLQAVLVGRLTRDYLLPYNGPAKLDILGGNLAYAAAGLLLWGGNAGLASRVSSAFPLERIKRFQQEGCDLSGIKVVDQAMEERFFTAYSGSESPHFENPLPYFAERQLPFPLELLNYDPLSGRSCSRSEYKGFSFHVNDLPRHYLDSPSAHICPIDFISHKILPSLLRSGMIQTLSMRACSCYMEPSFWEEIHSLVSDLTVFSFTENQGLRLFQGRSLDIWQIMEAIAAYGAEYIIVNMKDGSIRLFDKLQKKRWIVPAYPVKVTDPTGCLDAFDGAFLLNYRRNFDALEGTLHAVIGMSFAQEGSGPYFLLDSFTGLKEARLEALRLRIMAA
ncbi:MAG: carbohydrate kinase family protein [Anaerolineaceae bacterium]|nr:carbohydrate kinase family protein [Anaerolineaceae bacterium]